MDVIAVIGGSALFAFFAWLASAIAAALFSEDKGFGERIGLASGLILAPIGIIVWLLWPAKDESNWAVRGPSKGAKVAMGLCLLVGAAGTAVGLARLLGDDGTTGDLVLVVLCLLLAVGAVLGFVTAPKRRGGDAVQPAT